MQHFKTLSEYLAYVQLPQPEHPMLTILSSKGNQYLSCPIESPPPISNDCYVISLKKVIKGNVNYGRTKYDATNGAIIFLAPRQVIQWTKEIVIKQQGFLIMFHEDYLNGTALAQQIREYGFFSYTANEALHLSPNEERQIQVITDSIESEYHNNQDAFSKDIIISQLS
ncbi:MAG: AraC family transcriptional regulator, partial [Bacteroidota bacterium]